MAGWAIQQNYKDKLKISTAFQPKPEWQTSLAIAVRQPDTELKAKLDEALGRMLDDKRIPKVLAKYGVAFVSPN
jgi:ABC-type amino acid transport substrate-binding protein